MSQSRNSKPAFFSARVVEIYQQTFSLLRETPTVLFLFVFLALLDLAALMLLFLSHSEPVSTVLAPMIRTFWGSRHLHYPDNLLLLPKIYNYAHLALLSTFGILFSGLVIKQIEAANAGKPLSVLSAFPDVLKKFFPLLMVWLVAYGCYSLLVRTVFPFIPRQAYLQLIAAYFLGVVIQALFIYLIPALLIANKGFVKDIGEGFRFGVRHLGKTSALIAIPTLFTAGLSIGKILTPYFVSFNPEIVLWVLIAGVFVSMLVDMFITTATTILFLRERQQS